jgi:hypothetical protein
MRRLAQLDKRVNDLGITETHSSQIDNNTI